MNVHQSFFWETEEPLLKRNIETVQINMGNRCNQACFHCHIGASPKGEKNMDRETAGKILDKLLAMEVGNIEFTGGTPELNPNLEMLVRELAGRGLKVTVRTSLTVLDNPEYRGFIDLYHKYGVKIIASLPSVFEDPTDGQRGKGVFSSSVNVLRKLNDKGYGTEDFSLDLVYNPSADRLPPEQSQLEQEYKQLLEENYGIHFNNLITIVNSPIRRFKNYLINQGKFEDYLGMLMDNFNHDTLGSVMCRNMVSVDYRGCVYDCDFNLALDIRLKDCEDRRFWEIDFDNFTPEITCDRHCYACTANLGSSCHGALLKEKSSAPDLKENVRKYYGEELTSTKDLKTSACCTVDSMPAHVRRVLPYIAEEIKERFYGCGSPVPLALEGLKVLDLGCGTGRDSYVVSKLVGEKGLVYGIDFTEAQIETARKYVEEQAKRFGYSRSNAEFIFDNMENVGSYFAEDSLDLVISNCVLNLLPEKREIFSEIFRILKPGGELYFADVFADRRVPEELMNDPALHGECLAGAMYIEDFRRLLSELGYPDYRVVEKRRISLDNPEIEEKIGMVNFYSLTVRAFKIDSLEDICEDYGQTAVYKGTIPGHPHRYVFDDHHTYITGKPELVCGNTAAMLEETRLAPHFIISGDRSVHFGAFNCSPAAASTEETGGDSGGGACC